MASFSKLLDYSWSFYKDRLGLTILFSIPVLAAFLIPIFVPVKSYLTLGGVFIRTGSIPDISFFDLLVTVISYLLSILIFADSIVNINLIIKSRRTKTPISLDLVSGFFNYATKILYLFIILILLVFAFQIGTFELPFHDIIFSLVLLMLSLITFFVAPAIVIDNMDTLTAVWSSYRLITKKGLFVIYWTLLGLIILSAVSVILSAILPSSVSPYLVLLINSLFIFPFLTILQTQLYMEKYPLAN